MMFSLNPGSTAPHTHTPARFASPLPPGPCERRALNLHSAPPEVSRASCRQQLHPARGVLCQEDTAAPIPSDHIGIRREGQGRSEGEEKMEALKKWKLL